MDLNLSTKQLKYVVALSDAGSFSVAANELNISQPSLSQYIKKIEKQIGLDLFYRTNQDIRLTDAGVLFVDSAKKILDIEHQMETGFSDISSNKTGSIIVGTAPYRSMLMMPQIAKKFKSLYPGMHIAVHETVTSDLLEKAEKGEFDIFIVMLPIDDKAFSYVPIATEEIVLAVPFDYPDIPAKKTDGRKYPAIDIKNINNKDFVTIYDSQVMGRMLNDACKAYNVSIKKSVVVKSLEAQINMVKAGLGMALVPTGIERICNKNEVKFYSFEQELPTRQIVVAWQKGKKLPKVVTDLIEISKSIEW